MSYLGDIALGATLDCKFCTVTTTGAPTTLAGTPVISAYPDNSVTQLTAGITLTVDFDGVTGLNNVRVVATSGNGYASGSNYQLVITTGTVGGTSVVGYVVAEFSIEARSALRPTTAGRTADVDAAGGVEVGSFQTGALGAAAFAAGAIDAAAIAADAIGASEIANGAIDAATFAAGAIDATAIANGAIDAATFAAGAIDATAIAADAIGASELAADAANEIADAILARNVAGGSSAGRTVKQALYVLRNKVDIAAGTMTVYQVDDTTSEWTAAVTTAAGNPISTIDPA